METIYGRRKHEAAQQHRHARRRLAAFDSTSIEDRNIRRRRDYSGEYHPVPGSQASTSSSGGLSSFEPSFSGLDPSSHDSYIGLDDDATMAAPGVPDATTAGDLATAALANVGSLQDLPHFEDDDHTGTEAGLLDFSLLGGSEGAVDPVA